MFTIGCNTSAVICGSLEQRCQWLSSVRQTKLTKVHSKTWELVLASVAAFVKTPALLPNLIIQQTEVGCTGEWGHSSIAIKSRQSDLLKLETVKTINTPRKINATLLNIKTNRTKLVSMCGYKLATNWQKFTEIHLAEVKILQKVFLFLGGATFFDSLQF